MSDPDDFFQPDAARALEAELQGLGKDVEITVHQAGHAFMNEENPLGTFDQGLAGELWPKTIEFFKTELA